MTRAIALLACTVFGTIVQVTEQAPQAQQQSPSAREAAAARNVINATTKATGWYSIKWKETAVGTYRYICQNTHARPPTPAKRLGPVSVNVKASYQRS